MCEIIDAFCDRKEVEALRQRGFQFRDSSLPGGAEEGLEFGEEIFDRIEIRTVGRRVNQWGADRFDGIAYSRDFVGGKVRAGFKTFSGR